jgi:hypothetical protein
MTDKSRPRKPLPKQEGTWRAKRQTNPVDHRLSRDAILSLYTAQPCPEFPELADLDILVLPEAHGPVSTAGQDFTHQLGTEVNSRKQQQRDKKAEATPEWYTEDSAAPLPLDPLAMLFKDASEAEFQAPRPANALTEYELLSKQRTQSTPKRKEPAKLVILTTANVKNFPQSSMLNTAFTSVTAQPEPTPIIDLDLEEKYSAIDVQFEAKLKAALVEDDTCPEWDEPAEPTELPKMPDRHALLKGKTEYPAYIPQQLPMQRVNGKETGGRQGLAALISIEGLMQEQLTTGNPFAPILMEHHAPDHRDFATPTSHSSAYEKTWYYKDPNLATQGPFDSIQMFNWYAAGFFKPDLPLSTSSRGPFIPLAMYRGGYCPDPLQEVLGGEPPKTLAEVERQQRPFSIPFASKATAVQPVKSQVCESATNELKNLLGIMSSR